MSYSHYLKIKNQLCFLYEGHNPEYLVQLRLLFPKIKHEFPETVYTCACRPEYADFITGSMPVIDLQTYYDYKNEYGFCYQITYDAYTKEHPIVKLFTDANLKNEKFKVGPPKGHIAYISALGDFPNENLTSEQIQKADNFAKGKGFKTMVVDNKRSGSEIRKMVCGAAYVVGAANEMFYEAIGFGTPTALISTGPKAEEAYRKFVESPKVLPETRK